jgi:hypothetical protein
MRLYKFIRPTYSQPHLFKSFECQGHGTVRAAAAGGHGQGGGGAPPLQWTDRGGRAGKCDECSNKDAAGQVGTATAELTGVVLALMQELWDDVGSGRTTFRSVGIT